MQQKPKTCGTEVRETMELYAFMSQTKYFFFGGALIMQVSSLSHKLYVSSAHRGSPYGGFNPSHAPQEIIKVFKKNF